MTWVLCVQRARPIEQPRPQHVITDLYVVYDTKGETSPPPGFYKLPYDLNKGTSGNYVYLCCECCCFSPHAFVY